MIYIHYNILQSLHTSHVLVAPYMFALCFRIMGDFYRSKRNPLTEVDGSFNKAHVGS